MTFSSFYNVDKLNNLFKNLDTISFFDLITENKNLILRGYERSTVSERINSFFGVAILFDANDRFGGYFYHEQ